MRTTIMLYLIGHRADLALGLMATAVAVSVATGTIGIPLPWLVGGSSGLSVDHLLAVVLLAAHVTLLTGELAVREETGSRSWWWADSLGVVLLLTGPVFLAFSGDAGLLQNTLLYLTMFFLITLAAGPDTAYPATVILIFLQTILVAFVPDSGMIPVFWEQDVRVIGVLGVLVAVLFAVARRPVKTGTRLRLPG